MAFVRLLVRLLRDKNIGRYIVPIVPDEARTFGMEALFRQFGIYSHAGQLYEPVDSDNVLYYREAMDGQILEEGINEAGSMASFIAAGELAFQPRREHDPLLHLLLDVRLPADRRPDLGRRRHALPRLPAGRHGRPHHAGRRGPAAPGRQQPPQRPGLPHGAWPTIRATPTRLSVIVLDGIRRMYYEDQDIFYYITLMNENYEMPILPLGSTEGICRASTGSRERDLGAEAPHVQLFGSGAILRETAAGPGPAGAEVRRRQQRLQRDQLQDSLLRRPRLRSLEPAASRRAAAAALRRAGAGRRGRARSWRHRITPARSGFPSPLGSRTSLSSFGRGAGVRADCLASGEGPGVRAGRLSSGDAPGVRADCRSYVVLRCHGFAAARPGTSCGGSSRSTPKTSRGGPHRTGGKGPISRETAPRGDPNAGARSGEAQSGHGLETA